MSSLHPGVAYTLARLALFTACAGLLYLAGFRSWFLVVLALLISALISLVLLRGQRAAFADWLAQRAAARREEKERLRAVLRGDDEPPAA